MNLDITDEALGKLKEYLEGRNLSGPLRVAMAYG